LWERGWGTKTGFDTGRPEGREAKRGTLVLAGHSPVPVLGEKDLEDLTLTRE